jgi:hypothetical protein
MARNKVLIFIRRRDWRIWFGTTITLIWMIGGIWYLALHAPEQAMTPEVIGSFLEGAFAPLAFLWLVLGLFMQQRELAINTQALQHTSEQSTKQTMAIAATEMNARQETFFKIAENVKQQLGGISGMLYSSSMGPAGDGLMSREDMDDTFSQVANGDVEIFARLFLTIEFIENRKLADLLYGTEIRARHSRNFMRAFEKLRKLAINCDIEGIIEDSLMQNAFGLLYQRMLDFKPGDENIAENSDSLSNAGGGTKG